MTRWMTMPAVFLLAACGSGGAEKAADMSPAADTVAPPATDMVAPRKPTAPKAANDGAIPAAIRGRWAIDAADCIKRPGTDLTVLTIDAANLRFHESHGELARVRESDAARIVADYRFSGEGEEWDRRMRLELADDGRTLVRHDLDEGADAPSMRYSRCA
ncbi:MAG: hypothetical protein KIT23_06260 [Sphingopyxis sp.]|nr:hypothetical protein [Sphingopyxis sp.]